MFFRFILLVVSLMSFLCSFLVSSCDENCADKPVFTPSRLVVKFGDPASASCSVCQHACLGNKFEVESPVGDSTKNGTTVSWRVDRLTEWRISPICYYNDNTTNDNCCTYLPVTVYQPPDNVSISFVDLTGPMFEGHQYTLQCTVQHVAPVQNLTVTFYRGQTALGQRLSNNPVNKPVTEIFTLNITTSKEDDGAQFWCDAKLELGPEEPQLPPVVMSQNITAIVLYKPQLASSHPDPITVTEGKPLQLSCSAEGNPTPSYTWMLPSAHLSPLDGSVLTINSVTSSDEGQYICSVSNSVGTVTVKFNVVVQHENCADKPVFTPSRLVVKFGDPASASCSVCQHACLGNLFDVESPVGDKTTNGTTVSWRVDRLTEWRISPICYYNNDTTNDQCCTKLPITVYQPPDNVSISFVDLTGPMFEGHQYTLQCTVQDVAPVQNLTVTFYRGQTALGQRLSNNNTEKKPVTEIFTLNITTSKEDDGAQFWCDAKLELGPEEPQLPPVVMSQYITAIVYYGPHLVGSLHPDPITIPEGDPLHLNCSAVGNPSPSYTWKLPSNNPSTSKSSVLNINSVTSADKGLYTCSVGNYLGGVTVKFDVDVKGNNTVVIIGVIVAVVVLAVILGPIGYFFQTGKLRLPSRHSSVPTAE
ncbi:vascular cell adhesion protein 1-like isoform X2 [Sebastes umbrosus]|uniref:vascular cell adhesion protein 1-like isoform X2 n=1 Tax=Sebastes umbrosus TaxID=72105 RepID=UPI00189E8640|nr:vascular cell adhesion protein 1-like isoform X2 [Sebastes umbrosus]XP_037621010.1 vascular cell adhesion protein 1-like isoform X2 [Sebastes umbrosus]